jgi:uncharacterized protein (TIGR00725 family)
MAAPPVDVDGVAERHPRGGRDFIDDGAGIDVEELHPPEFTSPDMAVNNLVAIEERALAAPIVLFGQPPAQPAIGIGGHTDSIRTYVRTVQPRPARRPTASRRFDEMTIYVAVIGGADAGPEDEARAEAVGDALARAGAIVVCGGLGGVMAAACRGAKAAGGLTVGLLPGSNRAAANPWVDVAIPTGLGEVRNSLVVQAADAIVAIGGEYGTLSEIALALRAGKSVVGVATWTLIHPSGTPSTDVVPAPGPADAAELALALAATSSTPQSP